MARCRFLLAFLGGALTGCSPGEAADVSLCAGAPKAEPGPSSDLYCLELTAAPGLPDSVAGTVELAHPGGPFSLAVDREGSQVYRPLAFLSGLPDPATLGPYTTYLAWATTPVMSPMLKLGVVTNGRNELPEISFDKFIIIVSAEGSADVSERQGRLVLRGGSPSTRLQPPDVQEFTLGGMLSGSDTSHQHGSGGGLEWTGVPMPPNLMMLPAEMALRPGVAPWLPASTNRPIPLARPGQLLRVENGDTIDLTASLVMRRIHGRTHLMYAYNGQVPGPLIAARKDAEIVVRFRNAIDLPSTIHWHGIRLENRFDGVPDMNIPAVAPGDSFFYHVRFPDTGVYWYHPHVREDIQQDLGLSANIIVHGDISLPRVHREELLLLDDILIGESGLVPFGADSPTHALMGRFGNVLLINGEPRWSASVKQGEVVRFWFTNAANTRTFNLSFSNARMKLVASDMSAFSRDEWVESVVIAPAERYAVDVRFDSPGLAVLVNRVRGIDHLFGDFLAESDTLGLVAVTGALPADSIAVEFDSLATRAGASEAMARAVHEAPEAPRHTLVFGLETRGLPFFTQRMMLLDSAYFHPAEWSGTMPMMNWATTGAQAHWFVLDAASGARNEAIAIKFRRGERARIRLVNQRNSIHAMQHPVHVHGQRFLVLAVNGVEPRTRAWKDTVLLPAGAAVDILVEFDNPGRWMLHCHIAEHLQSSMMLFFDVLGN